jgi:hypothetical protein
MDHVALILIGGSHLANLARNISLEEWEIFHLTSGWKITKCSVSTKMG